LIGIFVPVLPTTPFLLLAAACYARSSEHFHQWLLNNRWFGQYIKDYHDGLGIRLSQKITALSLMWLSICSAVVFAVDAWAKSQGLRVANPGRIKDVSAKLLQGEAIRLRSLFPIEGSPPEGIIMDGEGCDVLVSHLAGDGEGALLLVPPAVSLGVGCKRGTGAEAIDAAFEEILRTSGVHPLSAGFAFSLDRKADEPGILEFCRRRGLEYRTFSAEELAAAEGRFSASDFVRRVTGIDNVCERAAVLGSGGGTLLAEKQAGNGVTMALALKEPALRF
jgi:cobalt-precorrin 5A hydrolase